LKWDTQKAVERCEGVEGEINLDRMEHPIHMKDVKVELIDEAEFDPPEVPGQGRIIDTVTWHMSGEVAGQRPSQGEGQSR